MARVTELSVIVVTLNGRDMTLACLDAVVAGAKRPLDLIVVDNGSADGTADAVGGRFPQARIVRNPENRGFAAAVNQGLRMAKGGVIVLLNNDARPEPGALDALADWLEAHPEAGMAGPQLLHEDGRLQNSHDACPTLATSVLNKTLLRALFPGRYSGKRPASSEPVEVESLIGASLAVKREVVERVGLLDEDYFVFLEETDWCLRARRAGWRVMLLPGVRVTHLQGRTREQARARARVEYVRSLFTYFRKHAPGSYAALRALFLVKTAVDLVFATLGAGLTLFLWPRGRRRWIETSYLFLWLALFCPAPFGLAPAGWPDVAWRRGVQHG
jgi:hypothetical protein